MSRTIPVQESRFEYKGFPCVVLFQPLGFRTGYVGIPKGRKYYKSNHERIPVNCHGGLTYSSLKLYHQNDTDMWWIGFDCGHCCDGYDVEKLKEYFADDESIMRSYHAMEETGYYALCNEHPIRTQEYVEDNCRKIIDQLIALEEGGD